MKKCKLCGGFCVDVGNGQYQCDCCGNIFTEEDFLQKKKESFSSEATKDSDMGADIFDKNVNGVLEISMSGGRASGYLITYDGYAITNSHAVSLDNGKTCGQCTVRVVGESVTAKVVAMGTEDKSKHCSNDDLALIKLTRVPNKATPLKFGDYDKVRTGERIFVIGNSLGAGTCITSGIISDRNRQLQLMYDCATNPGNSGGPVFNSDGLVIGTHVAGTSPSGVKVQGMNLAIPCNTVLYFVKKCGIHI